MSYVALFVFPLGVIPALGVGLGLLTLVQRRPRVVAGRWRARDVVSRARRSGARETSATGR